MRIIDFATYGQWWACGIRGSRDRMDWWPTDTHGAVALFADGWQIFSGTQAELESLTFEGEAYPLLASPR